MKAKNEADEEKEEKKKETENKAKNEDEEVKGKEKASNEDTDKRNSLTKSAAFLPNQPILHTCVLSPTETAIVYPGDVMTFDTTQTALNGLIVLKKTV